MINRPTLPFSFNLMAKPAGSSCNLHCDYCYYKGNSVGEEIGFRGMDDQVLEEYIKQYIQSQSCSEVVFSWQGGEPLLAGLDFFRKAVKLQAKYAGDKKIENTIQTNGTLLTTQWCHFLKDSDFLVGISVDGPREIHDFHRNDRNEKGSWERTMRGISLLRDHGISFNTLTAVHSHSVLYPKEIYAFLKGLGSYFQQYSPVVERYQQPTGNRDFQLASPEIKGKLDITPWSVSAERFGQFLTSIFDEWVRNDVGDIFIQQFEASLASWLGEDPGLCLFRSTCGKALMIEENGDLYACDHYAYSPFRRGNIRENSLIELVSSEEQLEFGLSKFTGLPVSCRACEYLFACYGECPRNRFLVTEDGVAGLNYLCSGLKYYFKHITPCMDYMAKQIRLGKNPKTVKEYVAEL